MLSHLVPHLPRLLSCTLLAFGSLAHAQQVFRVTTIPKKPPPSRCASSPRWPTTWKSRWA
jgi:hypothetical protein